MRTIKLQTLDGAAAGAIIENEDGSLKGEGRANKILELAPGKTFDYWTDQLTHSHYLKFEVEG
jgi:hypothetical protein